MLVDFLYERFGIVVLFVEVEGEGWMFEMGRLVDGEVVEVVGRV